MEWLEEEAWKVMTEGEAWKVMIQLQKNYHPNNVQAIAEVRYSQTIQSLVQIKPTYSILINCNFAEAPNEFHSMLTLGANLIPGHLEMAMRKIRHRNWWKKWISTQSDAKINTEIVLNECTGISYVFNEKDHMASNFPMNSELAMGKGDNWRFNGKSNHCIKAGHRKVDCRGLLETQQRNQPAIKARRSMQMCMWTTARMMRLSLSRAQLKHRGNKIVKSMKRLSQMNSVAVFKNEIKENKNKNKNKGIESEEFGIKLEEMGMVNLKLLDMVKLLDDPSIWFEDMAATVHMTPNAVGMVSNSGDKLKGQSIMDVDGKRESTSMHGLIKGQMEVGMAMLTDFPWIILKLPIRFPFCALLCCLNSICFRYKQDTIPVAVLTTMLIIKSLSSRSPLHHPTSSFHSS